MHAMKRGKQLRCVRPEYVIPDVKSTKEMGDITYHAGRAGEEAETQQPSAGTWRAEG